MLALERATTAKPTLRARQRHTKSVHPAESTRTCTGAAHQGRVVTGTVTDGDLGGQLGDRLIEHGDVIGDRVRPGVARPQQHRRASRRWRRRSSRSDGTRTRPCSSGPSRPCSPSGSRCNDESMSNTTVAVPVVAAAAPPHLRRAPRRSPPTAQPTCRVDAGGTCDTASSPTAPTRTDRGCARRCSMSAHASPPPASINIACASTLPRSCNGTRSPRDRDRVPTANRPSRNRSANAPSACSPTWATTWSPPPSTTTEPCCYRSPRECPPGSGFGRVDNVRIPCLAGTSAEIRVRRNASIEHDEHVSIPGS